SVRLYIDGRQDGEGKLAAKAQLANSVVQIGYTAPDFPQPESFFKGDISEVRLYQRRLTDGLQEFTKPKEADDSLLARWLLDGVTQAMVADATGHGHD